MTIWFTFKGNNLTWTGMTAEPMLGYEIGFRHPSPLYFGRTLFHPTVGSEACIGCPGKQMKSASLEILMTDSKVQPNEPVYRV